MPGKGDLRPFGTWGHWEPLAGIILIHLGLLEVIGAFLN